MCHVHASDSESTAPTLLDQPKINSNCNDISESDSENSSDNTMPGLLEPSNEWSSDEELNDIQEVTENKKKALSAELLVSVPVGKGEHKVLLALADTGTSKTLGNKKALENIKGIEFNKLKTTKWKTKAGAFATNEVATITNARLPQFAAKREFNLKDTHLFNDKNEKYDLILGHDLCQSIGLDFANSKKEFHWHELVIKMVPSDY